MDGNLALNGVTLDVTDVGGMGPGIYNIVSYTGTLTETNGGIVFGSRPAGHTLQLQTLLGNKQINILDATQTLQFWNADGKAGPGTAGGGTGTWSNTSLVWAGKDGAHTGPMVPQPGFAIFAGESGNVTLDDTSGAVRATGLQFASDGYEMDGSTLTLVADDDHPAPVKIRVGDDGAGSASYVATIHNTLAGADGLEKTDAGTLVLTGSNTYSGGTTLSGGTLSVSSDANLGDASGALAFNGGTLRVTGTGYTGTHRAIAWNDKGGGIDIADAANRYTLAQDIVGDGALVKKGAGTLVLSGANRYGATLVQAGTLEGDTASLSGDIGNAGTVVFDQQADGTFHGDILGLDDAAGKMVKTGSGALTLAGVSSLDWSVDGGTLSSAASRLAGDVAIASAGRLVLDDQQDATYAGTLSGSGAFDKAGPGELRYTGDGSAFTGTTTVRSGRLSVGADGATNTLGGTVQVMSGASLGGSALDRHPARRRGLQLRSDLHLCRRGRPVRQRQRPDPCRRPSPAEWRGHLAHRHGRQLPAVLHLHHPDGRWRHRRHLRQRHLGLRLPDAGALL